LEHKFESEGPSAVVQAGRPEPEQHHAGPNPLIGLDVLTEEPVSSLEDATSSGGAPQGCHGIRAAGINSETESRRSKEPSQHMGSTAPA